MARVGNNSKLTAYVGDASALGVTTALFVVRKRVQSRDNHTTTKRPFPPRRHPPSRTWYHFLTVVQVDAKIAELPGGTLFPDELAERLIKMYDQNGDGVLQQSEFAPTEELRARLEGIFRERREEEVEARKVERKREMDNKRRVCVRVYLRSR